MENGRWRVTLKFLWFPLHRPNQYGGWKTKWLQFVKIRQQYWDGIWYDADFVE